jgi:hypothetical protein
MTAVMTYSSLKADILDYLDRSNSALVAQVPNFVMYGELLCAREVKNLLYVVSATGTFLPGQYAYLKPNRWLQTVSFNFGNAAGYGTTARANSGGTATLTFGAAHGFAVGGTIAVFNVGAAAYNGTWTVTAITTFTASYVSGGSTEAATPDSNGIATLPLEGRTALLPRSREYCGDYWPDRTQAGVPRFYADYDYGHFLVVPTPQIAYPFELVYFQQPEPLSDTNQTNALTQYAPDLLLFACLLQTAPYLKNDARIPIWQDRYDRAAAGIAGQNRARVNDASIMRQE